MFMHLQLPNASSLERTEAACAKVEQILLHTPGVKYTTTRRRLQPAEFCQHQLHRLLLRHAG